jgi:glycosyltransferase involved in cell wall biosynthesis
VEERGAVAADVRLAVGPLPVSVVIPAYGHAAWVGRAVQAAAAQTAPPAEILVVDDASPDATAAVVAAVAASVPVPVRLLRHPVNRGGPAARETGWRAATQPFIAFTDDDCVPDPTWLAAAWPALQDATVGAVEGRVVTGRQAPPTLATHQVTNLYGGQFLTANMIYRRAALAEAGGFTVPVLDDSALAFAVLARGWRIVFVPDAVVDHPPRPDGRWRTVRLAFREAWWRRYTGLLWRRYPTVAPRYLHWSQPTDLLLTAGLAAVGAGVAAGWSAGLIGGLVALILALPRAAAHYVAGRVYGGRDYLLALGLALAVAPVAVAAHWGGFVAAGCGWQGRDPRRAGAPAARPS